MDLSRADLGTTIVAIDPAVTSNEDSDETGLVVVARGPHQPETCKLTVHCPGHAYVLDDRSCKVPPHEWARIAVQAYDDWQADKIVAEVNQGGDMVGNTVRAVRAGIPYEKVRATKGKRVRAEPVAVLWEQGRGHIVGFHPKLEDELVSWQPDAPESPGRLDAMVWGVHALGLVGSQGHAFLTAMKTAIRDQGPSKLRQRTFGEDAPRPRMGCEHRFFGPEQVCVYCGQQREDASENEGSDGPSGAD